MRKGSITPFCALVLMLMLSLLLALLESARVYGLDRVAAMKAEAAADSLYAEYQPYLWQQYGLLFLDGAYGTEQFSMGYVMEQMEEHIDANCDSVGWVEGWLGMDLFSISRGELLLEGYGLATDDEGELFLNYIAEREKEQLPLGLAEDLYEQYQKTDSLVTEYGGVEAAITEAQKVLSQIKMEWLARLEDEKNSKADSEIKMPDTSAVDNLLRGPLQIQGNCIINMVFSDASEISAKASNLKNDIKSREKEEGTLYLKTDKDWYRKLLVLAYLEEYFANYAVGQNGHFLNYEMEYVLCGKDSDRENLNDTLGRIMLVREAANVAYLLQDKEKMELAEGLAGFIGLLAGGNPAVIKVMQLGIVAAWAYMESVLDVRSLVFGEKIPLFKKASEWTTDVSNLWVVFDRDMRAKVCEEGLNYTDYLKQLLMLTENQTLAYRMMEVMEMGLQSQETYQNCKMDHMIVMLRFRVSLESEPVFSSMISVGEAYRGKYVFTKEVERSYVP